MRLPLNRLRPFVPPIVERVARQVLGRVATPLWPHAYQGVSTTHCMAALHDSPFGNAFDRIARNDPFIHPDVVRLRTYFIVMAARLALRASGDFLFGGVGYGVAARTTYELVAAAETRRTLYLIDPFEGTDGSHHVRSTYNTDEDLVRRQYPPDARVSIHRAYLPDGIESVGALAFVHLNTGDRKAEIATVPLLMERLQPGGLLIIDAYALGDGSSRSHYDAVLEGRNVFTLPTGQGLVLG